LQTTEISDQPMGARDALARVGVESRLDHFLSQLREGRKQRAASEGVA
jgi:predicted ABC-type transport system involved in lysophospholipase L1 biosynthesis ATPase subunit